MAILLGYGASAINPYLAYEILADLALGNRLSKDVGATKALELYIKALCKGLLKIMSKMGISTLRSYRSAQVFEAMGLNRDIVDKYFGGTAISDRGHRPRRDRPRGQRALPGRQRTGGYGAEDPRERRPLRLPQGRRAAPVEPGVDPTISSRRTRTTTTTSTEVRRA